jgi:hypothetical protein
VTSDKLLSPSVLTVHMRVPYGPRSQGSSNGRRKPPFHPTPAAKGTSPPMSGDPSRTCLRHWRNPRISKARTVEGLSYLQLQVARSHSPCVYRRGCARGHAARRTIGGDSKSGPRTALGPTGRAGELPSEVASELTSRSRLKRASYQV